MQSRRIFIAGIVAFLASAGIAPTAAGSFVGTWKGDVPGIGEVTVDIGAVGGDGRVEGRMEFALHAFSSTFAEMPTPCVPASLRKS